MGIHGDALKMQRDWGLQPGGVVDLSEAAQDRGVFNGEPGAKWSLAGGSHRGCPGNQTRSASGFE